MEKDERLLPLPDNTDLQPVNQSEPTHYAPIYDDEFSETRSLREYWNVVYKRLPIILAMTVLTTTVVAFYMYRQPSIYEASAEMIIEPRKSKVQSKEVNINFGNDINYYNTQLRLLQNPDLMREVVTRLNLHRDPNLFSGQNRGILATVRSMFSSEKDSENKGSALPPLTENDDYGKSGKEITLTPEEKERTDRYANILLGGLRVNQVEGTNLVNIFVSSTNPALAAKTADTVGEVFIKEDIQRESEGGRRTLEDLTKSIEELRSSIGSQEQERIRYMQETKIPLREGKGNDLLAVQLQDLSARLSSAQDDRRKLAGLYEAAQRAKAAIFFPSSAKTERFRMPAARI